LVRLASCTKKEHVAIAVLRSLALLGQLPDDFVAESIG
jgi:hypothetical protein